ncbi:MAG: TetR/AcrR family transcriptional regulator [Chloroflexi bacterium]|nr:TetR/AcrR family transcriptional regulator [Chloroflexota bacterium]MCH8116200.1 TetR/AcrR family transcriptional regulator [Chloroflexota bacterium]MCI0775978.1 TetR/AcrR family transcriptional regulator [Chloroflexota bacterium]MCI0805006.1 TetR/AcrR family transcriptional regulator [Chloroflexota bacterium]MCI0835110.1 TetR/AcrR family transcriptional regulator [Chloroflexota bacterium]
MSPKVTEEYLEERRQTIISAAEVCFARLGIHATTLEDIRIEAGLSRGAVYHYFKSKEDIVDGLRERSSQYDIAAWERNIVNVDALEEMLTMFRYAMQVTMGPGRKVDSRVATFLWAEALINERIHASQMRLNATNRPISLRTTRRAQADGQINPDLPAEAVMDAVYSMFIGLTVLAAWEPDKDMGPAQQIAESFLTGTFLTKPHIPRTTARAGS